MDRPARHRRITAGWLRAISGRITSFQAPRADPARQLGFAACARQDHRLPLTYRQRRWDSTALEASRRAGRGSDLAAAAGRMSARVVGPLHRRNTNKADPVGRSSHDSAGPIHAVLSKAGDGRPVGRILGAPLSLVDYDFWLRALARSPGASLRQGIAYYRWHSPTRVSAVKWRRYWARSRRPAGFRTIRSS